MDSMNKFITSEMKNKKIYEEHAMPSDFDSDFSNRIV
jgi:hypothetical protein